MEMLAQRIRQLEYDLCAIAPLVTKRHIAKGVYALAGKRDNTNISTNHFA